MNLKERLESSPMTRIVAFGSSNTEFAAHCMGRPIWFDWLDLGIRENLGRVHHCINAGVCGETTRELLSRFDRDVAWYRPNIVMVTIGGNDSSPVPDLNLSPEEFAGNLRTLVDRIQALPDKCIPILQTYYSADIEHCPADCEEQPERFVTFMQIIRDVAAETDCRLIDHLARWEQLRLAEPETYHGLMKDWMHVNPRGNMLLGLDCIRAFGLDLTDWLRRTCQAGIVLQETIDRLSES